MEQTKKRGLTHTQMCAEAIGKEFGREAAERALDELTRDKLLLRAEEKFAGLDEKTSTVH